MDYTINENKINSWLDELNNDRNKLFNEVKNDTTIGDKIKEDKIKSLDAITRTLLHYRNILKKVKKNDIA
jgi:hypothetical protein